MNAVSVLSLIPSGMLKGFLLSRILLLLSPISSKFYFLLALVTASSIPADPCLSIHIWEWGTKILFGKLTGLHWQAIQMLVSQVIPFLQRRLLQALAWRILAWLPILVVKKEEIGKGLGTGWVALTPTASFSSQLYSLLLLYLVSWSPESL